jgi:hypothetical protein
LIGDRAYDSDPLDAELRKDGIEMIAPHRYNRSKPPTQDRVLPILGESAAAVEPRQRPLNDPALGQHHESFGLIRALDDLRSQVRQDFFERVVELAPLSIFVWRRLCFLRTKPARLCYMRIAQ